MVFFKGIRKTRHYIENHEDKFPWGDVVEVIFTSSKNMRKKGDKIEIETQKHYILCEIKDQVLWVINAKRK